MYSNGYICVQAYFMPRKVTEVNVVHLAKLKNNVLENVDFKLIRSVDCDLLAKVVSEKTNTYVNGITFKRLYGFTKYPFNPSLQTLDILSQFIGYKNWYEYEFSIDEHQPISKSELEILLSFYDFDLINHIEFHDGGIQSMSRKISLRFREDVPAFKRAIPRLAKMNYARLFFIEHFPDYDNLCNYYYLLYEEYLANSKDDKSKLFGSTMLFLKSFWTLDEASCKKYLIGINKIKLETDFHPYLIGRSVACNMLYDFYYGDKEAVNKHYIEYLKIRESIPKDGNHFKDFCASEYIIAECLIHVEGYAQCLELIDLAYQDFSLKMEFVRKGYYRQMQLVGLIAQKKLDPNFEIKINLDKIKTDNFYFISQKYYCTIFHYLKYLQSCDIASLNIARELSNEMGNSYLREVFLKE